MCNRRNPVACIIPPYIVDRLFERGGETVRERAIRDKLRAHRFRSDRQFFAATSVAVRHALLLSKARSKVKPVLEMYDAKNRTSLPGQLLQKLKSGTYKDQDAQRAYEGGLNTWLLYNEVYGRNSVDDQGIAILQTVHYGDHYQNAFWNGRQMVYGDGDGRIFDDFTSDLDIIAHELTHGVMQYAVNLNYENQSGALNESFSDVFGVLTRQRTLNEDARTSDWLIGKNVLIGDEYALRSMKAPGTAYLNHPLLGDDPQPANMQDYLTLPNTAEGDWGGVHFNSGIPNFAFYVAAYNRGGNAWETIGRIWYATLIDTDHVRRDAGFADVARNTLDQAVALFGEGSLEHQAVQSGWQEAGVL